MVEGIEAIGEAVTGGMAARAVEPSAGEGDGHGESCLNCGTALIGPHCHQCGQKGHVHRTLGAFGHDIAHSVLHFDGKVWRTLPLLAWHPGELTRRYIGGERAKFVSPMALFLFSVFLMFATISAFGAPFGADKIVTDKAGAQREYERERAEIVKELQGLRSERARLIVGGEATGEVDGEIRDSEKELARTDKLFKRVLAVAAAEGKRETGIKKAADGEAVTQDAKKVNFNSGISWIDHGIEKANANPSLLLYKLQTNAYKFSWALVPISVPFVWLLFLHRRRYRQYRVYDHTVFVTYSIAFMSLGVIALSLLRPLGLGEVLAGIAITFIPPIHMYRQLRGAYQLSRWSALWRTAALLVFASIAAGLFMLLLLALGVLG